MDRKIDIKNWKTGEVIFSYTCENNTIKKTVEEAVKQGVILDYADLRDADLMDINLCCTILDRICLNNANLTRANMNGCIIRGVRLWETNLSYANLTNADLIYADLSNAIIDNVVGLNNQCPKEGSFIGWKKCYGNDKKTYIVKLEIPDDAKRSSSTGIKCRCDKAKVLEIQNIDGTKANVDTVYSGYDKNFAYKIGEIVEVPDFDERCWVECTSGIHFFMNKENAIKY